MIIFTMRLLRWHPSGCASCPDHLLRSGIAHPRGADQHVPDLVATRTTRRNLLPAETHAALHICRAPRHEQCSQKCQWSLPDCDRELSLSRGRLAAPRRGAQLLVLPAAVERMLCGRHSVERPPPPADVSAV